tara:strand:- start:42 stop:233 length:192 start_codon:yes stop_codon:yes gene_type:complete
MSAIDDFWNEVAITQMASGGAPSVITPKMRKALDGDKEAAAEIQEEIDVNAAVTKGIIHGLTK